MSRTSAVASLIAAGFAAQAQTSHVTLYGYLDLGLVKESHTSTQLGRGYNNWLGFKGTEDLGGDLSVLFNVQMRFKTGVLVFSRCTASFTSVADMSHCLRHGVFIICGR